MWSTWISQHSYNNNERRATEYLTWSLTLIKSAFLSPHILNICNMPLRMIFILRDRNSSEIYLITVQQEARALVDLCIVGTKYLTQQFHEGRGLFWLMTQSYSQQWKWELQMMTSAVRKQGKMNVHTLSYTFSFLFSPGQQPREWFLSPVKGILPLQLI